MIVFEDQDIMVIHKPSGIATETAKLGQADVVSELKNYRHKKGEDSYIGVIHRLDQPVEGLLVFAKNQDAAKKLTSSLQKGIVKKKYHALVPKCTGESGELTDYLLKDSKTNLSKVVSKQTNGAKEARLAWKYVKTCEIEPVSDVRTDHGTEAGQSENRENVKYDLAEIEIFTGRHHQIRVQMSHAGMPLLGDTKYGTEQSCKISNGLGIRQTALLASRLYFPHPGTGKMMSFEIPFPEKWHLN